MNPGEHDPWVRIGDAFDTVDSLADSSVDAFIFDPPYYGIVDESWDNAWKSPSDYAHWIANLCLHMRPKLKDHGSLIFFGAIGKHGVHPFFQAISLIEHHLTFRNLITWQKRRAYGKSHDYLFCREEIVWFSRSPERTRVTFNIPLTEEKRGYAGFDPKYPAKSEYKRVSNVWTDIPELMRPEYPCQKPTRLMARLIETHTNPGSLVVDPFVGWGSTGVAARALGRDFIGGESSEKAALEAEKRIEDFARYYK